MKSLLTSAFIPLALIGSSVLAGGVVVNLTQKSAVPVRPAVFQQEIPAAADTAPAVVVANADSAPGAAAAPAPAKASPVAIYDCYLSSDGLLPGKISVIDAATGVESPAMDLTVDFMQKGEVKSTAKPGVGGVFQARNLAPGVYSVIASGKAGYLAMGVRVHAANAKHEGQGLAIDALAVPSRDVLKVLQIANSYVPVAARTAAPNQLIDGKEAFNDEQKKDAETSQPNAQRSVVLLDGKRVSGRITRLHPETGELLKFHADRQKAFLVQGDAIVAEALLDEVGRFTLEGARAGAFSLVVAGPEGFAAFGIQVVPPTDKLAATAAKELIIQVSLATMKQANGVAGGAAVDMANFPAAYRQLTNSLPQSQNNSTPPSGGTAPPTGGTGGGGIGGGGGGGLGALGAALGAAGLAAGLANQDDSPSSP